MSKWEKIRLGDVCEKKILSLAANSNFKIEYIDISSIDNIKKKIVSSKIIDAREAPSRAKQLLQKNDILVSTVRPNLNAVAHLTRVSDKVIVGSTGYCILRCNEKISHYYLFYFCQSKKFIQQLVRKAKGASYPAVTDSDIKNLIIPLPPIEVQKKIAQTLDAASDLIALHKKHLAELENLIKATFYDMFGDPVLNEKGWKILKWEQIFDTRTGKLDANAMCDNGKYPFFTCAKGTYWIDEYAFDCEALLLAGNNATANYDVKYYNGKFNAYQRTYVLTLKSGLDKYYMFKILLEDKLSQLQKQSKGTNTKYLTLGILKRLDCICPPLSLQNEFAAIVTKIEEQKALVQKAIDESQYLFDSLMSQYFE